MTLALLLALAPLPVNLDELTVEQARTLAGRPVVASFLAVKPAYTWRGRTFLGAADQGDDVERGASVAGNRLAAEGKRVEVAGWLRVIDHPAGFVGRVLVPAWVEVRVEGVPGK